MPNSERTHRLNGPMVARIRKCAADTSPNWDGKITIYPPEARELVGLMDDVRRLARRLAVRFESETKLRERIESAHAALAIDEFDGDSCPDLESTIEYAIGRYRAVCASEAEAADRIQDLRIQLDERLAQFNRVVTVVNTWQRWREQADDGAPFTELYDQVLAALDDQGRTTSRP